MPRPRRDTTARRGIGELASLRYRGGSDDIDLDRTVEQLIEHPLPEEDDIIVRERVRTRRSVLLLADVSGSMRGERVRTAAATVGALAAELSRDDLAVVAFWSDAAILSRLGEHVPPQSLLDMMLRFQPGFATRLSPARGRARAGQGTGQGRPGRAAVLELRAQRGARPAAVRGAAAATGRAALHLRERGRRTWPASSPASATGAGGADTYTDVAPALSAIFARDQEPLVSVVVVATIIPLPEHRDEVIALVRLHHLEGACRGRL